MISSNYTNKEKRWGEQELISNDGLLILIHFLKRFQHVAKPNIFQLENTLEEKKQIIKELQPKFYYNIAATQVWEHQNPFNTCHKKKQKKKVIFPQSCLHFPFPYKIPLSSHSQRVAPFSDTDTFEVLSCMHNHKHAAFSSFFLVVRCVFFIPHCLWMAWILNFPGKRTVKQSNCVLCDNLEAHFCANMKSGFVFLLHSIIITPQTVMTERPQLCCDLTLAVTYEPQLCWYCLWLWYFFKFVLGFVWCPETGGLCAES